MRRPALVSIVNNDESMREATKGLVSSLGYQASTFSSTEEFLNSDLVHRTSCLITDMQMPGLSGADLQPISQGRCMPTIFVTAFPDEMIRARVLTAGAIGYLSKPFTEESLIACLDTALSDSPQNQYHDGGPRVDRPPLEPRLGEPMDQLLAQRKVPRDKWPKAAAVTSAPPWAFDSEDSSCLKMLRAPCSTR